MTTNIFRLIIDRFLKRAALGSDRFQVAYSSRRVPLAIVSFLFKIITSFLVHTSVFGCTALASIGRYHSCPTDEGRQGGAERCEPIRRSYEG